jgi:phosphotriesterase-related protein
MGEGINPMAEITTVLGKIRPEELGFTSMHEHTVCDMTIFRRRYEELLPPDLPVSYDDPVSLSNLYVLKHAFILSKDVLDMNDEELFTLEVQDFAKSGGRAIVDMSVPGIRTNIKAVQRISEISGVHIIASTGLYSEDSWPERFRVMDINGFQAFMRSEIEHGIDGTDIRAGHIKAAITDSSVYTITPFSECQKLFLKAAVRTSTETGVPISVHPPLDSKERVIEVADFMLNQGVNPAKTVIAHQELFFVPLNLMILITDPSSWRLDVGLAKTLLDKGFNISIDSFGHTYDSEPVGEMVTHDWQRLAGIIELIKTGYASQIVLGTDVFLKFMTRRCGGEGYSRLTDYVVPMLRQAGTAEADITKMTIDNPARILARNSV